MGKKGEKKWKRVEVNLVEHVKYPVFPDGMSPEYYDDCFRDYLLNLGMEQLPMTRPLWEIHIVKYPTREAAGNVIFKLHHSLGDGYSLMGALLSCLQRQDNPLMPLTFPGQRSAPPRGGKFGFLGKMLKGVAYTAYDFGWSLIKSSLIEDEVSPIRSGVDGVEFRPVVTLTTTLSIDQIKEIKNRLHVVDFFAR